jgi:hypothetical protein
MFFELIGTIVAGVAVGLGLWALNRVLKGRLPGWVVPAGAGIAMLVATISSEYGWYERTRATMPEGLVVAHAVEESAFWRPWTYAVPLITRFVAVDRASIRTHPEQPGQRLLDLVLYGRWARTAKVPVLIDCAAGRRADIVDGVEFASDGAALGVTWHDVAPNDPVLLTACKEN